MYVFSDPAWTAGAPGPTMHTLDQLDAKAEKRTPISAASTGDVNTQVLITTHSPEVLDVLDPEDVLLVTAPDGVTEVGRLSPSQVAEPHPTELSVAKPAQVVTSLPSHRFFAQSPTGRPSHAARVP